MFTTHYICDKIIWQQGWDLCSPVFWVSFGGEKSGNKNRDHSFDKQETWRQRRTLLAVVTIPLPEQSSHDLQSSNAHFLVSTVIRAHQALHAATCTCTSIIVWSTKLCQMIDRVYCDDYYISVESKPEVMRPRRSKAGYQLSSYPLSPPGPLKENVPVFTWTLICLGFIKTNIWSYSYVAL